MKILSRILPILSVAALAAFAIADENHEIIEKVMKEGLKGKTSPLAKVLEGKSSESDTNDLNELIGTLEGTKAPVGEQDDYEKKVAELIEAIGAVAGGDSGPKAIERLDSASNCKACHSDHKPKKE